MGIFSDAIDQFKAAFKGGVEKGKQHSSLTPEQQARNNQLAKRYTAEPNSTLQHGFWSGYQQGQQEASNE